MVWFNVEELYLLIALFLAESQNGKASHCARHYAKGLAELAL